MKSQVLFSTFYRWEYQTLKGQLTCPRSLHRKGWNLDMKLGLLLAKSILLFSTGKGRCKEIPLTCSVHFLQPSPAPKHVGKRGGRYSGFCFPCVNFHGQLQGSACKMPPLRLISTHLLLIVFCLLTSRFSNWRVWNDILVLCKCIKVN